MDAKLGPCPFCGAGVSEVEELEGLDFWYVECPTCGADGPKGQTKAEAVRLWNARHEAS